ncbi:hypothetical protein COO60DRAFT_632734 [Scenedesmus sp. NREL 46B-D3]|nr:hypothetical protein COO60DRAFT_632734 [Scenedesmus sp. NREL 46B-D3]
MSHSLAPDWGSHSLMCEHAVVGREPAWYNVLPIAAVGFTRNKLGLSKVPTFQRYKDVLTLFKPPMDNQALDDDAAGSINSVTAKQEMGLVQASAKGRGFTQQQEAGKQDRKAGFGGINTPSGGLGDIAKRALSTLFKDAKEGASKLTDINSLLAYPVSLRAGVATRARCSAAVAVSWSESQKCETTVHGWWAGVADGGRWRCCAAVSGWHTRRHVLCALAAR